MGEQSYSTLHADDRYAASPASQELVERAECLKNVATRMETFLSQQIERIASVIQHQPLSADDDEDAIKQLIGELENEQKKWQAERADELSRIRQDGVRLLEAWKRLESEKRQVLAIESVRQLNSSVRPNSTPAPRDLSAVAPPVHEQTFAAADSTFLQFQQLRREVQRHARRRHSG